MCVNDILLDRDSGISCHNFQFQLTSKVQSVSETLEKEEKVREVEAKKVWIFLNVQYIKV
jgi:hypothetical protein